MNVHKAAIAVGCALGAAAFSLASVPASDPGPDYVLYDGNVFTSNPGQPYVEALAVKGQRISAIGSTGKILATAGAATRKIDLRGRVVVPGFNDAHYHLFLKDPGLDMPFRSMEPAWEEVKAKLAVAITQAPKGSFIFGEVGATVLDNPQARREALDQLAPQHAVVLRGWTGHFYILNSMALSRLDIHEDVANPVGGKWERSPTDSRLSGAAFEYAAFQIHRRLSELVSRPDAIKTTRDFADKAVRLGITTVQHMSMPLAPARLVDLFESAGTPIRSRVMRFLLTDKNGRKTAEGAELPHHPSPLITVSGTKYILDGTPIEHSCALRQPYADRPSTSGWMDFTRRDMEAMLRESLQSKDPLIVHVVGDRTTETFLDAMEATGGKQVWAKRRVRIEHGDGLAADLLERARELGVIVVENPTHFSGELGRIMIQRLGAKRAAKRLLQRSILQAGIPLAIGSDGPFNPYLNIMRAAAYTQHPSEAITREQAVVAYTLTSAYAEFAEKAKGSLEPGKLADLAVLSQDIFTVPAADLPNTESVLTMVGGKIVYEKLNP